MRLKLILSQSGLVFWFKKKVKIKFMIKKRTISNKEKYDAFFLLMICSGNSLILHNFASYIN